MDLEENIEFILELWKCKNWGDYAKVNPEGMTLCGSKQGEQCEYQYKNDGDEKCYCARWYK